LTEIIEYALVLLVSSLVVGFSFGAYSMYSGAITQSEAHAGFSSILTVAMESIDHGEATVTLPLVNVTLTCHHGVLVYASHSYSANATLPADCDFGVQDISGTHTLTFATSSGILSIQVA
jgi:hypothetical protein